MRKSSRLLLVAAFAAVSLTAIGCAERNPEAKLNWYGSVTHPDALKTFEKVYQRAPVIQGDIRTIPSVMRDRIAWQFTGQDGMTVSSDMPESVFFSKLGIAAKRSGNIVQFFAIHVKVGAHTIDSSINQTELWVGQSDKDADTHLRQLAEMSGIRLDEVGPKVTDNKKTDLDIDPADEAFGGNILTGVLNEHRNRHVSR